MLTTSRLVEAADRIWVGTAPVEEVPELVHPTDVASTAGMSAWRAREFLAGRNLLRATLREVCPNAADTEVVAAASGKPYLRGQRGLGISVSHDSGTVAVCVAVGKRVGVDVQHPPKTVERALVRRCLHTRADQVMALAERDAAMEFAWVWTAQEACVKATGEGLAGRPWSIDVPPGRHFGTWRSYLWVSLRELSATPLSCAFSSADQEEQQ